MRLSAQAAGEKVKRTGVPFRFNPMNSRERRVIHLALRNETSLRSESGGAGPGRHVVVYPAGMASLPAPPYVPEPRGGFGNAPRSGFGSGPRHGDGPPRRSAGGAPRHGDGPPRGPRRRS